MSEATTTRTPTPGQTPSVAAAGLAMSSSTQRGATAAMSYAAGSAAMSPANTPRVPPAQNGARARRIYFAIAYSVTDRAFERAAATC